MNETTTQPAATPADEVRSQRHRSGRISTNVNVHTYADTEFEGSPSWAASKIVVRGAGSNGELTIFFHDHEAVVNLIVAATSALAAHSHADARARTTCDSTQA